MLNKKLKISISLLLVTMLLAMSFNVLINIAHSYFSDKKSASPSVSLTVMDWFGVLDGKIGDETWGTESNPYLINEQKHIKNLYLLQNTKDNKLINENTVFQISDTSGNPCSVGGESYDSLLEIPSIGSEDFPFVSKIRGVKGDLYELPSEEMCDTSAFVNIKVTGYTGQIDIGLFGVVGKLTGDVTEENASGLITDLLLYNIQIATDALGEDKNDHQYYNALTNHETNHIGILAGHAQNSIIKNISVYYSGTETAAAPNEKDGTSQSDVEAIVIASSNTAKYTSSGGIIGFYKNIFVGDEAPVSTESNYDKSSTGGGNTVGTGTGVMFSGDLWDILTEGLDEDRILNSYPLQSSFGNGAGELYENSDANKTYFTRGVFTFAHSFQLSGKDCIVKLWTNVDDSNQFEVASSYTGTPTTVSSVEKYTYQQVTSLYEPISADYRYLLVYDDGTNEHVLTRSGNGAVAQQLERDSNYITIPTGGINFYSAKVIPTNLAYTNWAAANNNSTSANGMFFYYGPYDEDDDITNGRPLRTYSDGLAFADTTSTTSVASLILVAGYGTNEGSFLLKRPSTTHSDPWYVGCTFNAGELTGFTNTTAASYYFKIYKVGGGTYSYTDENGSSALPCERITSTTDLAATGYLYFITNNAGTSVLTKNGLSLSAQNITLGSTTDYNTTVTIPDEQLCNWTATMTAGYYFSYGGFYLSIASTSAVSFATATTNANFSLSVTNSAWRIYRRYSNSDRTIQNTFSVATTNISSNYLRIYRIDLSKIKINSTPTSGGGNGTYSYTSGGSTLNCERVTATTNLATSGYAYFITNNAGTSILTRNGTSVSGESLTLGSTTATTTTVNIPRSQLGTWTALLTTGYYFNYSGYYLAIASTTQPRFIAATNNTTNINFSLSITNSAWRIYRTTYGTIQNDFTVATTSTASLRIYRIDLSQIIYTPDSSGVITENDDRMLYHPAEGATTYSYDMSKNVLFYTGTDSTTGRYRYDITNIESLAWADENLEKIISVNTALTMADATEHRFSGDTSFGLTPVTLSSGDSVNAPKGSVVFQVTGTGNVDTANINIIVATNPQLMVNQTIACSRIISTSSTSLVGSFPLPPVPGQVTTTPILVTDTANGLVDAVGYTNFNTVLVAYTFEISTNFSGTRTYFLESSQGAASFVYFSIDSTAADKARNPDHENELFFSPLNGIDYVYSMTSENTEIITIGNNNYVQSLIVPYFGYAPTPTSNENRNDFTIIPNYNLAFSMRRTWVTSTIYNSNGYGELYITASGQTALNVNFTECIFTYNNTSGFIVIVYADHVVLVKDDSLIIELP